MMRGDEVRAVRLAGMARAGDDRALMYTIQALADGESRALVWSLAMLAGGRSGSSGRRGWLRRAAGVVVGVLRSGRA